MSCISGDFVDVIVLSMVPCYNVVDGAMLQCCRWCHVTMLLMVPCYNVVDGAMLQCC